MGGHEVELPNRESRPRRRRSWLAALLSLVAPGAGQLYSGERRGALSWFLIFIVLDLAFFFALPNFHLNVPVLCAFALLAVGGFVFQIAAAVHAFIRARRAAPAALGPYQRGWLYAAMMIALPALNLAAAPEWIKSYRAASASNVPTILVNDRFLVELGYYRSRSPQRGEMIVFISPKDGRTEYIKRLVGLPGDKIQLRAAELYLNGQVVQRQQIDDYSYRPDGAPVVLHQYLETLPGGASYRVLQAGSDGPLDNTPVYDVPPAHYFTLGDNRDNSVDSRMPSQIGFVPAANLVGRVGIVYWPLSRLGIGAD
jgi:signal peptidase I